MAKSEVSTPKLFTVKKARIYLEQAGYKVGDQQVRVLFRTNEVLRGDDEGVREYENPITEEKTQVATDFALDRYIAWKRENPEGLRKPGRKSDNLTKVEARMSAEQIANTNAWLDSMGYPNVTAHVVVKRGPRKNRNTGSTATPDNSSHEIADQDLSELELIEVG